MKKIAFVPVRGGSKSIPFKNIKNFAGRPLVYWVLQALEQSPNIDEIVLATDAEEISSVVNTFGFKKVKIYKRLSENASDTASTESVMLEYLNRAKHGKSDYFILVQATNPFLESLHIDQAFVEMKKRRANSLLSAVPNKRFFWNIEGKPINYDYKKRHRRQDFAGQFMENGSFYISKVESILKSKNRLSGKIAIYEMPLHSGVDIDEPCDWIMAESLFYSNCGERIKKIYQHSAQKIKLFLTDLDGVLTDAGMYYSESGDELKKFNTHDGMALRFLQKKLAIKTGIITTEDKKLNIKRAEKLKIDFLRQGVSDKFAEVNSICNELGIDLGQVAFVGDDVNDEKILSSVGFSACPANSAKRIKNIKNIIHLSRSGGSGAVREWVEYLFGEVEWS